MKKEKMYDLVFNRLFIIFAVCLLITFLQFYDHNILAAIRYVLCLCVYTLISNSIYQYLIDKKLNK